jgi:hypothetical protein
LAYLNKAEYEGFSKGEFGRLASEKPWKDLTNEEYTLKKSQNPKYMSEAFAYRKESLYPVELIKKQQDRIKMDDSIRKNIRNIAFYEKEDGSVKWKFEEDIKPIVEYPYKGSDKRGCVQMIEDRINENPDKFTYFAGVDPVATDKSTTSDSLFAVYIVKGMIEKKKRLPNGIIEVSYEGMTPVCWYVGRYDDMKEHHLIAEYMIRYYNAHTLVENNVSAFIDYMKQRNLRQYLVTKNELRWAADLGINNSSSREYGVYMSMNGQESRLRVELINHSKNYLNEELDRVYKDIKESENDSRELIRIVRGVERICDIGLLEEFKQYRDKGNYDRWFAFNYALKMASFYFSEGAYVRTNIIEDDEAAPKPTIFKQPRGFFKNHNPTPLGLGDGKYAVPSRGFFKTK